MKYIVLAFLFIFIISCSETTSPNEAHLSSLVSEEEVLSELNFARSQPKEYAKLLQERIKYFNGKLYSPPGKTAIMTNEGVSAVEEAIEYLNSQQSVPLLQSHIALTKAAEDHALDQCRTGDLGHIGSDGSTFNNRIERYGIWKGAIGENIMYGDDNARDIVIDLIVDDGVPDRGHRKNIYNAQFLFVGIAFAEHPNYRYLCVQDFANTIVSKSY